jgi:N-acetylglucosaminyldiphosphoundecaprenol N-acetyl-beta-D-mannosaminyltransferase
MIDTFDILGVRVSGANLTSAAGCLEDWIRDRRREYVCFAPVSTVVDCQRDPGYRAVINGAGLVNPDGMPLVWAGRRKGCRDISRTYGPDFMDLFFRISQDKGYRHFFYGGTPPVLERFSARLKERFPRLQVAGQHAPDWQEAGAREKPEVLDKINAARPDILWIGLGSPKQDYWMANHRDKLDVPVMAGVGAAFDFWAGVKPQAPGWMRRSGLEWFFRLCSEPRRLWKRYLIGNTLFVYWLARDYLKKTFR